MEIENNSNHIEQPREKSVEKSPEKSNVIISNFTNFILGPKSSPLLENPVENSPLKKTESSNLENSNNNLNLVQIAQKDYSKLKVDDLKHELTKLSVAIPKNAKKSDLIELLKHKVTENSC